MPYEICFVTHSYSNSLSYEYLNDKCMHNQLLFGQVDKKLLRSNFIFTENPPIGVAKEILPKKPNDPSFTFFLPVKAC